MSKVKMGIVKNSAIPPEKEIQVVSSYPTRPVARRYDAYIGKYNINLESISNVISRKNYRETYLNSIINKTIKADQCESAADDIVEQISQIEELLAIFR